MAESLGKQLRAAIRAAPKDHALRLVYADWLMERGDPRGEWIALSCGQAPEDVACEMRRRALWQAYGEQWMREDLERGSSSRRSPSASTPHAIAAREPDSWIEYRAGFPHTATMSLEDALAFAAVLARYPLHTLRLSRADNSLAELAHAPFLETVRALELSDGMESVSSDALAALLASPRLGRLQALHLGIGDHGAPAAWSALERYPRCAELTELSLSGFWMSSEHARWLGRSMPGLTSLTYHGQIQSGALEALTANGAFRLRDLGLHLSFLYDDSDDVVGAAEIESLLASPIARDLIGLALTGLHRGNDPVLSRLRYAGSLKRLKLLSRTDAELAGSLGDCELPVLESLEVGHCYLGDARVGLLTRFPTLTTLGASTNQLTWRGVEQIVAALPRLEHVDFASNKFGAEGMRAIAASERAPALRHLGLSSTGANAAAIDALIDSDRLTELRSLDLSYNQLLPTGLRKLANAPFDWMADLSLIGTKLDRIDQIFGERWLPAREWQHEWPWQREWPKYERRLLLSGHAAVHRDER